MYPCGSGVYVALEPDPEPADAKSSLPQGPGYAVFRNAAFAASHASMYTFSAAYARYSRFCARARARARPHSNDAPAPRPEPCQELCARTRKYKCIHGNSV